ncbi:hypothetical protein D3C75_1139330 [compost metagenome]
MIVDQGEIRLCFGGNITHCGTAEALIANQIHGCFKDGLFRILFCMGCNVVISGHKSGIIPLS